jgi:hypothetical protein
MSALDPVRQLPAALARAALRLLRRLKDLEARVDAGDDAAWAAYERTVETLAGISPALLAPDRHGSLLTTAQMADRLGVAPKTLLKHKAKGAVRPALQRGKLIRWRGDEAVR